MSLLCVPIKAKSLPDLKKLIKKAEKRADLVEIWVDTLRPAAVRNKPVEVLALCKKPVIIVNKGKKERGGFAGSEKDRVGILESYLRAGASFVDVPIGTNPRVLKSLINAKGKESKIILSYHDFRKTPSLDTMKKLRDRGFSLGADIVKIVAFAGKMEDNLEVFRLLDDSRKRRKPCIAFCMGKKGLVSRVLAPRHGSYIIYIALDSSHRTAPGQLTLDEYTKISLLMKP
jgi:3-dehydroquinate dehydratase type I